MSEIEERKSRTCTDEPKRRLGTLVADFVSSFFRGPHDAAVRGAQREYMDERLRTDELSRHLETAVKSLQVARDLRAAECGAQKQGQNPPAKAR